MQRLLIAISGVRVFTKRNWWMIRAYLIFFGCLVSFAVILLFLPNEGLFLTFLKRIYAKVTSYVLNLLGNHTQVLGTTIQGETNAIEVITACTGLFITVIFLSAVIAYPSQIKAKLIGFTMGIPAIFLINLIRLVSLFYVGLYAPQFVDKTHLLVWQSLIIFFALVLWLFWVERFAHARVPSK